MSYMNKILFMLILLLSMQSPLHAGNVVTRSILANEVAQYIATKGYGIGNLELRMEGADEILRINYPKGSIDPGSFNAGITPLGGAGVIIPSFPVVGDAVWLSYDLRLPVNFPFVHGGKLPGLAGGKANTGGNIPNGYDGFSARLMWRGDGAGEVYAYLPTSDTWGTSLGRGSFNLNPGVWMTISEYVKLNTPGTEDGVIDLYLNNKLVHHAINLRFRDIDSLKIDKLYFETFFGGHAPDWAAPYDTYVEVKNINLWIAK